MARVYKEFREEAASLCKPVFDAWGVDSPSFERPDPALGDLAIPCFSLAKGLKKSPPQIAGELAQELAGKIGGSRTIESVQQAGPYVNFTMKSSWAVEMTINSIMKEKRAYGHLENRGEKMVLEHTSANPTDKLHVGRARNPIIGDTLARICRAAGYDVETQYYVDDMGRQAVTLAMGEHLWSKLSSEAQSSFLGPYQYAAHLTKEDGKWGEERGSWLHALETQSEHLVDGIPLQEYVDNACQRVMKDKIVPALQRANINIDSFINESRFMRDGSVAETIEMLKALPEAGQDENGAWFIDMEKYGVKGRSTKFFFTRGDGTSLYATRDIAYHLWKFSIYDRIVNILGEDHKLEAKQISVCMELLGEKKLPEVVFYAFVGLPEGKMSTRKGQVVYFDDLLDEAVERAHGEVSMRRPELSQEKKKRIAEAVGVGAVRYNIVRVQPEKRMVFKWEDALNFEGDSGPFIQYSYARATSIMEKAGAKTQNTVDCSLLVHPSEIGLIKHLALLPDLVEDCSSSMKPHSMASYAHQAAVLFNQFYRDCRVVGESDEIMNVRLALVVCARDVMASCLEMLGLEVLEEM
ncbi:MAG: arginine--tRNA ligase [Candidatus Thermoplasmatota archaeon]|nr:arginine--tRNA ligase [Candidatus Thermoplasmatota archaeon]